MTALPGPLVAGSAALWVLPLLGAASPSPPSSPSATPAPGSTQLPRGLEPTDVTPGVAGFLATAFVVVLSIFLILNLVSRMRRIRHRGALEEAREREEAERAAAARGAELDRPSGPAGALGGHDVISGEAREVVADPPERDDPDTAGRSAT